MRYELAHLRERATNGRLVDFAVFNAKPRNNTSQERDALLRSLIYAARNAGLKVDAAGLVYEEHGQAKIWGDNFTRSFVENNGIPQMNRTLDVS